MRTNTVIGIFKSDESALTAAELAHESATRADARVYLPAQSGEIVVWRITWNGSPALRAAIFGALLGMLGFAAFRELGIGWLMGATGLVIGVLLGVWRRGGRYRRQILKGVHSDYTELLSDGKAVVVVEVKSHDDLAEVRRALEVAGGVIHGGAPTVPGTGESKLAS